MPIIQERNRLELLYQKDRSFKDDCKSIRHKLKKAIKDAKNKWVLHHASILHNMHVHPYDTWQLCQKIVKGLNGHHHDVDIKSTCLKKPDGTLTTDP